METLPENHRSLPPQLHAWAVRLRQAGLDGIAGVLLDAAAPLAPLGAQFLYVAQPTLGLFISPESIGDLAEWLDSADGVGLLQRELEAPPEPRDTDGLS